MRRGFWFAAGAGAGIYAAMRGRRAAEAFTADGLRDRWQALGLGARLFRDEVASGKAEAEPRLRERFGRTGLEAPALLPRDGGATTDQTTPQLTAGHHAPSLLTRDGASTNEPQEGKQ
jgi:hypothetical protein